MAFHDLELKAMYAENPQAADVVFTHNVLNKRG